MATDRAIDITMLPVTPARTNDFIIHLAVGTIDGDFILLLLLVIQLIVSNTHKIHLCLKFLRMHNDIGTCASHYWLCTCACFGF